ncbi:putative phosphatase regulatory subunit-domain-containing protein [Gamsiella multidivaricata]|uniref:putative phosphatase regulatory subunit-domain-containing protein n=1 Tax=Gamsiella multidivaricata TaxID=101098 RepID=UPI00221ED62D|nr:putative phosphatase regulatory subunit-domain-containing protein [Gamsiella multidivaricata]KAI7820030.1 putative phosphatase regulatory subunit-domain-containing protein [Gamsiella multidivaricata]
MLCYVRLGQFCLANQKIVPSLLPCSSSYLVMALVVSLSVRPSLLPAAVDRCCRRLFRSPSPASCATNATNNQYSDSSIPKIITAPASPTRTQSIALLKNGLPIKSAMKSPVVSAELSCATPLSHRRPSPIRSHTSPTPHSPKFVHFNAQLEHIRLFLQGEMPSCVAERETIVDTQNKDEPTSDIKLTLTNWSPVSKGAFQPGNIDDGAPPLRVENIKMSEDQTGLVGTVLIQNIAFHKHVSVRYTIDFWQTQSEVSAEFEGSIPGSALDRFAFKVALDMDKSVVEKTFCFAVRYQVIGREFWDSNNGMNYQVECKRVVVVTPPVTSDLSKQMNTILFASHLPDYGKPVLKKKTGGRYDLSTSLSAAYSQPSGTPIRSPSPKHDMPPMSQTAYRPSEYITPIQSPPGYHHSLYASSPKFMDSYLSAASPPDHFQIGFERLSMEQPAASKRGTCNSWSGREVESGSGFFSSYSSSPAKSAPITIPSSQSGAERPQVGSTSYVDLVDRYCFYEPSPHSSPYSSYPNSPPAPCIRG